jgi:hypothetical protein
MTQRVRSADGTLLEHGWLLQVEALARHGGWAIFHAPDNRPGRRTGRPQQVVGDTTGFPDLILLRDRELIVAELKTDKGRLGPGQQDWLDRWGVFAAAVGMAASDFPVGEVAALPSVEVHLWRPADLFDVQQRLASRGAGRLAVAA